MRPGHILLSWALSALVALAVAYVLQAGVHIESFWVALVVALVLGFLNAVLRPIAIMLTLPITVLTFGLFILVLNALFVQLAALLVHGFDVENFWWALLFSVALSLANWAVKPSRGAILGRVDQPR